MNQIILPNYKLTSMSQKVFSVFLQKIKKTKQSKHNYIITRHDYANYFKRSVSLAYMQLQRAASQLNNLEINIYDEKLQLVNTINANTVALYNYDLFGLSMSFNNDLMPYFLKLKSLYNQQSNEDISKLSSTYSIRLYGLLLQLKKNHGTYITHERLKSVFNLGDKYGKYYGFMKYVIRDSITEIFDKTGVVIKLQEIKEDGYMFLNFSFNVSK